VGATVGLLDQLPVVFPFQRAARELHTLRAAGALHLIQIGVRDDGQATRDQIVVYVSLALQFLLFAELLREPTLHLSKTQVVHLRRVDMGAG